MKEAEGMYPTIKSFLEDWSTERAATLRVFRALTDGSLSQKAYPEGRSLGFIAWHIVLTIGEMGVKAGLPIDAPAEEIAEPTVAADIAAGFDTTSTSLADKLQKGWTDAMLDDEVQMYGQAWKRSAVLASLVRHQAHHRGQMTILMRQAGLQVPGVYGPAREEWAKMGMQPMK
jgi:uncharacterized damage-inducible protein DinB